MSARLRRSAVTAAAVMFIAACSSGSSAPTTTLWPEDVLPPPVDVDDFDPDDLPGDEPPDMDGVEFPPPPCPQLGELTIDELAAMTLADLSVAADGVRASADRVAAAGIPALDDLGGQRPTVFLPDDTTLTSAGLFDPATVTVPLTVWAGDAGAGFDMPTVAGDLLVGTSDDTGEPVVGGARIVCADIALEDAVVHIVDRIPQVTDIPTSDAVSAPAAFGSACLDLASSDVFDELPNLTFTEVVARIDSTYGTAEAAWQDPGSPVTAVVDVTGPTPKLFVFDGAYTMTEFAQQEPLVDRDGAAHEVDFDAVFAISKFDGVEFGCVDMQFDGGVMHVITSPPPAD